MLLLLVESRALANFTLIPLQIRNPEADSGWRPPDFIREHSVYQRDRIICADAVTVTDA
jgi:hypothetical protein